MNNMIFSGFGIEIFKRDKLYFIRYDAGELAVQFQESEISKDEASRAQRSEESAYDVLLACQQRS